MVKHDIARLLIRHDDDFLKIGFPFRIKMLGTWMGLLDLSFLLNLCHNFLNTILVNGHLSMISFFWKLGLLDKFEAIIFWNLLFETQEMKNCYTDYLE